MSHLLFIRKEGSIPSSLREALATPDFRVVVRESPVDATTALQRSAFDLALVYSDAGVAQLGRNLQELRGTAPDLRIIVIAPHYGLEEEQTAFSQGADLYFSEPVPAQTLQRMLTLPPGYGHSQDQATEQRSPTPDLAIKETGASALHVLRDFSNVLGFSLDYKAFSQHFILKLREHISFSRIGIFIEATGKHTLVKQPAPRHLECVASLGIPADLIECFQLSRDVGIGRSLKEHPRILNARSQEAVSIPEIRKEFAILGCQLAVPITDRERLIGLAVLNGPVTGRGYTEDELQLLYLLMEELGLAIRNSRLHLDLANHGRLIENVLCSISSGAIVIDENLDILYTNDSARQFLGLEAAKPSSLGFADLPAKLATKVHRAVEKGDLCEPFYINGPRKDDIYRASILPFTQSGELDLLPHPTMVLLEDFTKIEASKQSALKDSREELISLIAERFAHEIRNSLVPLSTHAQLIDQRIDDPKFQKSLKSSLVRETARIKRFSEQMLFLAQNSAAGDTDIDLSDILKGAFKKAKQHLGLPSAKMEFKEGACDGPVSGNPEALSYAFEELFLNALQANPEHPVVHLEVSRSPECILLVRMRDEGPGFNDESIAQAAEPFFTTRNTGVGLGLSVARKVISEHRGYLSLNLRSEENDWDIEIKLPELIRASTTS